VWEKLSCGPGEQFGQADEVVGGYCQGELPIDLGSPRWRIVRRPATVLAQPKASSIRLRMRCEIALPGWRVVRPSIAERRPFWFCATCGATACSRSSSTKSALS
jgi:hypothetical protein